jgi:hypothetical protein
MGLVSKEVADRTEARIVAARELSGRIDSIVGKGAASDAQMEELREAAMSLSESTVCEKEELDWSEDSIYASIPRIMGSLIRRR